MKLEQLTALLEARSSTRAFEKQAIGRSRLERVFAAAARAPSWCNIQPWNVQVLSQTKTREISGALLAAARSTLPTPEIAFPGSYPEPFLERRRRCGGALYGAMGIARDDKQGRWKAWLRNYEIFGAPHLAVVSRDNRIGEYATLDVGVWLGLLFAAAAADGLGMCAMASIAAYPQVLRSHLDIPETDHIVFGIALGQPDKGAEVNTCKTTREPVAESITFARAEGDPDWSDVS